MRYWVAAVFVGLMLGHGDSGDEGGPTSVFARFPTDPSLYIAPVAAILRDGVVERFGLDEFESVVVSHELHQHIGIYTVIGAKMGVRAREVLDAPRRSVEVVVETVPDTPLACATDGIQAAMGSTYGQDLIRITPTLDMRLECRFLHGGKELRMSLKPEFASRVKSIIEENIEAHGNLTPEYFNGIRAASYRVWGEWDRTAIFDEMVSEATAK